MTDEEIKALQDKVAQLEKDVATKDALIAQKNDDIVGIRRKYKNVADMTEEEKEALSAKELELQQRVEEFEKKQEELTARQQEILANEITSRRESAIKKLVGDNKEIAKKIEDNYNRIKDVENAQTEEQIAKHVREAFNMLGDERPEPIASVVNGDGGYAPGSSSPTGFADTAAGKDLASRLGLPVDNKA